MDAGQISRLVQQIQQRVKEGRWEVVGGMWVEPDLNLPDGESTVRQILVAKRYFQKNLGVDVRVGWWPTPSATTGSYRKSTRNLALIISSRKRWRGMTPINFR